MAKKERAVYEPGELSRVRGKLGSIDEEEARRMARILGGEVGTEKTAAPSLPAATRNGRRVRRETVEMSVPAKHRRPSRAVDIVGGEERASGGKTAGKAHAEDLSDDPSVQLRVSYFERVKMDRYAAQFEFGIKNSFQALVSALTLVGEPVDYVNPRFVTQRVNMYYHKLEQLVNSTKSLLPRNNAKRSERLKKTSPYVYAILETIRSLNIERIDKDLAKIQAHPRSAQVSEFADILRAVYKPLFILEKLNMDTHIKGAYKLLYKLIYIENPTEPKEKNQDMVRIALTAFADIRSDIHFGMYPLLMKFISDRWLPYERLFVERRRRFMAFIDADESNQINPLNLTAEQAENGNLESLREDIKKEQEAEEAQNAEEEDPNDPEVIERKAKEAATEAEQKALERSLLTLETLFPQAGWTQLHEFPDIYPYFAGVYGLRRGYDLIAPTDPLLQTAVLMHILEDLCVALRYVSFGRAEDTGGSAARTNDAAGDIITNWRLYIDDSFIKEYLPRLSEYCRTLEHSAESRNTPYAKRTMNELRWTKRLYFLPYYKFESLGPPPFQKQDITAIYSEVRKLRRHLTMVAAGIERGTRSGGAEAKARCDGIENPWERYNFEVPNPVSRRMDALLGHGKRNNAALIFIALSTVTVLDYLMNNESSWAYGDRTGAIFRSVNGEGIVPMFGVEKKLDADQIFKNTMKKKHDEAAGRGTAKSP